MSNSISNFSISSIKKHLVQSGCFNGVDLLYYQHVLTSIKTDNLVIKTEIDAAKIERVFTVLDNMQNGKHTTFKPLVFKTQCCFVDVAFADIGRPTYTCPNCNAFVTAHNDLMPMGTLAHKKIRKLRVQLHTCLDSIWSDNKITRKSAYSLIASKLDEDDVNAHIGNVSSVPEAVNYFHAIQWVKSELSALN